MARSINSVGNSMLSTGLRNFGDDQGKTDGTKKLLTRLSTLPAFPNDKVSADGLRVAARLPPTATRDEVETAYKENKVPLLFPAEQQGASLLFDTLKPAEEFTSAPSEFTPVVKYGPREEVLKKSDALRILQERGVIHSSGVVRMPWRFSIEPNSRRIIPFGPWSYSSITAEQLFNRIAGTPPATHDGDDTDITPQMLKTQAIEGDPFSTDGLNEAGATNLTDEERRLAGYLYAHLFVPNPILPEFPPESRFMGQLGDSNTPGMTKLFAIYSRGVTANADGFFKWVRPVAVTFEAPRGTELLLGSGSQLDYRLTIENDGWLELTTGGQKDILAAVLHDPDGTGVLQPRVVGRAAITMPPAILERIEVSQD